ncbi:hypothetical protein JCM9279_006713 [Rhodotorula babjevae]
MATDSPAAAQAGKHPRLASLSRTNDLGSPARSHSRQQLGTIGGRSGPGYSPYARRVATRAAAHLAPDSGDDDDVDPARDDHHGDDEQHRAAHDDPSPPQQSKGLFGKVRSLPGRMLGMLSRSSSSKQLASSSSTTSLAQVRAELDQVRAKDGQGMARSHTSHNLAAARLNPLSTGPAPLPASSSMSALSSFAQPQGRSSHSTLRLPVTASTNGSGSAPSFLTAANLGRHSTRAASPAPSTASVTTRQQRNRSPSPLRTGLAGSMSAFQLAQPPSPTSASAIFNPSALGGPSAAVSNPFGLSSRSPFASSRIRASPSVGAGGGGGGSIAGFSASSAAGSAGHPLFPYASTVPRGTSPGLTSSFSLREGLASAASASGSTVTAGLKRPYARAMGGSPLGPRFPPSGASVADVDMRSEQGMAGGSAGGAERARKKQLVWDPVQGLVSRERLEKEKAAEAPALPKNEAERILEVLEGMGRTPLGDAKRASARPKHVNVPAASLDSTNGRLPRSSTTPSILSSTPYAARSARLSADPTEVAASSSRPQQKGLQAVFRAREERRRALLEQEREERERERAEDAERERVREQRRRDRRRRMDELAMVSDDGEGDTDVFSAGGSTRASRSERGGSDYGERDDDDDELRSPRRVTRSAAKKPSAPASSSARDKGKGKDRLLEPPTPSGSGSRRSTRASSRTSTSSAKAGANAKSPSPAPTPRKSSRSARAQERDAQEDDDDDAEMTPAPKRTKAKSPARSAPPKSPSPAPPIPSRESSTAPSQARKISFPAPSSFPSTAPSTASGRSSLRPGKSHSSRSHQASSKVFSAKEEDLPPLDDDALSKIQMPAIKFPANFSFGAAAGAPPASTSTAADDKKKDESASASGSSLLSRLGAPPAAEQPKSAPAFSFGASATKPAAPAVPSFSFHPSSTTSTDKKDDAAKPAAAALGPASSDFFAKPSPAPPKPAFSFGDAASSSRASSVASDGTVGTATTASKPTFFDSFVKAKEGDAPPPIPAFSFGAAPAAAKKDDDKASMPGEAASSSSTTGAAKPAVENPFTAFGASAFGTPAAQPVKQAEEKKGGEDAQATAPAFSFGNLKPVEKKDEEVRPLFLPPASFLLLLSLVTRLTLPSRSVSQKKDAPAASPFPSFGAKPAASTPSFSFGGAPTSAAATDKPAAASPFSFGASAAGTTAAPAPEFVFGKTPATPQADEKKDAAPTPLFGGLAPGVPAATTDDAGDSGMEDEGTPEPPKPAPAAPSFSFGAPSGSSGAAPPLFGGTSSGSFNFSAPAAAEKKEPSPFGQPGSSSTGSGLSGLAASTPKPAFSFGNSASPSPAPPSPAAAAVPSFSFGAPTSSANGTGAASASSFTFGAPAPASNPFTSNTSSAPAPSFGAAPPLFQFGAAGGASPSPGPASPAPASPAVGSSGGFNFNAPTASSTFPNGAGAAAPSFLFGQPTASQPTTPGAAPPPFAFGSPAPTPGASAAQPFQFGAPAAGAAPPVFGGPAAANGAGGGFGFGAPPPAGGAASAGPGFPIGPGGGDRPTKALPARRRRQQ